MKKITLHFMLLVFSFSFAQDLTMTLTGVDASAISVKITGPWWDWDPNGGPAATENTDGSWTVTLTAPTDNMEYLWVVDGTQENLVDNAAGGECTTRIDNGNLITDYSAYANRVWKTTDILDLVETYDDCTPFSAPVTNNEENPLFDFESVNYTVDANDGITFSVVADPEDATNNVGKIINDNAANIYDSTSFSRDFYLDLTGSDKTITFRVWSDEVKPGLLKLFHSIGGNGAIEKAFTTSGNGWETTELDFSSATYCCGNAAAVTFDKYRSIGVFFDFAVGTTGTYYIDDFEGAVDGPATAALATYSIDFETATNVGGFDNLVYTDLVDNDVTDGINSSAKAGKLEGVNATAWANVQSSLSPDRLDLSTEDKGFSLMVKGNRATTVKFKIEGTDAGSTEKDVEYTDTGVWQKLLFNFSTSSSVDFNKIVIFIDPGAAAPSADAADDVFMIDNLVFDTWENLGGVVLPTSPSTNAPDPIHDAADVISVYSDSYTNINVTNFDPNWGQGTDASADFDPTGEGTNTTLQYLSFDYQGTDLDATDVSAMTHVHLDIWTSNETGVKFSPLGDGENMQLLADITEGEWNSYDIPLSTYTGVNMSAINQLKFDGGTGGSIYIDNIYFWNDGTVVVETGPETSAPTPIADASDVVSIYSDTYTDVTYLSSPTFAGGVLSTYDVSASDETLKLEGPAAAGFQFNYNTVDGIDLSSFTHFHMDYYIEGSLSAGEVLKSIIQNYDSSGGFQHNIEYQEFPSTTGTWVSIDAVISDYDGGLSRDNIAQIMFSMAGPPGTDFSPIFLDNIYFYREATQGLDDNVFNTVKMFPNPAKDTVQFSVNSNENLDIEIFDMLGKSVLRVNDVQNEVNISDLNSGLYFVQMTLGTQQATKYLNAKLKKLSPRIIIYSWG